MNIIKTIDRQTQVDESTGRIQHGKSVSNNFKQVGRDAGMFADLFDGAISFRDKFGAFAAGIPVLTQIAQGLGGLIGFLGKDLLFDGARLVLGIPKNLLLDNAIHGVGAGVQLIKGRRTVEPPPQEQPTSTELPQETLVELEAQLQRQRLQTRLSPR